MEGEQWAQYFCCGWDQPVVKNSEGQFIVFPQTDEQIEKNETIRRTIRQILEDDHRSIQTLDGEGDDLQHCSRHQGINLNCITAPKDLGSLDLILLNSSCPLCLFLQHICNTLLAVQLKKPGTWTECSLASIQFRQGYFLENGLYLSSEFQSEPFSRTTLLNFGGETCEFRQEFGSDMIPIHRFAKGGQVPEPLEGRPVHSQVDLELIRSWLYSCRSKHDLSCEGLRLRCSSIIGGDLRVLDVRCRRVVTAPENCQFTALSYVWGPHEKQPFKSLKSNSLNTHGELKELEIPPEVKLPATIEDAIQITSELGIRYIWVDMLCLVQDDPDYMPSPDSKDG